jgi:hypothetical protein
MIPQPIKAVILVFPLNEDFEKKKDAQYARKLEQVGKGHIDPTVIWIKQTVRSGVYLIVFTTGIRILIHVTLMPASICFRFV